MDLSDFEFYLKFAKKLVLALPKINERVVAAAWIRRLIDSVNLSEEVRTSYLKLLLFILQKKGLYGVFKEHPDNVETLQDLPSNKTFIDIAEEVIIKERQERISSHDKGDAVPFVSDTSADYLEYAAVQEIQDFGIHAYYAISKQPINQWSKVRKNMFPKAAKSMMDVSGGPENISGTQSTPQLPKGTPPRRPASPPPARESPPPAETPPFIPEDETIEEIEASPPKPSPPPSPPPTSKQQKSPSPRKSVLGAIPPSQPLGRPPSVPEEREPPTWGSNLYKVQDSVAADSGYETFLGSEAQAQDEESGTSEASLQQQPSEHSLEFPTLDRSASAASRLGSTLSTPPGSPLHYSQLSPASVGGSPHYTPPISAGSRLSPAVAEGRTPPGIPRYSQLSPASVGGSPHYTPPRPGVVEVARTPPAVPRHSQLSPASVGGSPHYTPPPPPGTVGVAGTPPHYSQLSPASVGGSPHYTPQPSPEGAVGGIPVTTPPRQIQPTNRYGYNRPLSPHPFYSPTRDQLKEMERLGVGVTDLEPVDLETLDLNMERPVRPETGAIPKRPSRISKPTVPRPGRIPSKTQQKVVKKEEEPKAKRTITKPPVPRLSRASKAEQKLQTLDLEDDFEKIEKLMENELQRRQPQQPKKKIHKAVMKAALSQADAQWAAIQARTRAEEQFIDLELEGRVEEPMTEAREDLNTAFAAPSEDLNQGFVVEKSAAAAKDKDKAKAKPPTKVVSKGAIRKRSKTAQKTDSKQDILVSKAGKKVLKGAQAPVVADKKGKKGKPSVEDLDLVEDFEQIERMLESEMRLQGRDPRRRAIPKPTTKRGRAAAQAHTEAVREAQQKAQWLGRQSRTAADEQLIELERAQLAEALRTPPGGIETEEERNARIQARLQNAYDMAEVAPQSPVRTPPMLSRDPAIRSAGRQLDYGGQDFGVPEDVEWVSGPEALQQMAPLSPRTPTRQKPLGFHMPVVQQTDQDEEAAATGALFDEEMPADMDELVVPSPPAALKRFIALADMIDQRTSTSPALQGSPVTSPKPVATPFRTARSFGWESPPELIDIELSPEKEAVEQEEEEEEEEEAEEEEGATSPVPMTPPTPGFDLSPPSDVVQGHHLQQLFQTPPDQQIPRRRFRDRTRSVSPAGRLQPTSGPRPHSIPRRHPRPSRPKTPDELYQTALDQTMSPLAVLLPNRNERTIPDIFDLPQMADDLFDESPPPSPLYSPSEMDAFKTALETQSRPPPLAEYRARLGPSRRLVTRRLAAKPRVPTITEAVDERSFLEADAAGPAPPPEQIPQTVRRQLFTPIEPFTLNVGQTPPRYVSTPIDFDYRVPPSPERPPDIIGVPLPNVDHVYDSDLGDVEMIYVPSPSPVKTERYSPDNQYLRTMGDKLESPVSIWDEPSPADSLYHTVLSHESPPESFGSPVSPGTYQDVMEKTAAQYEQLSGSPGTRYKTTLTTTKESNHGYEKTEDDYEFEQLEQEVEMEEFERYEQEFGITPPPPPPQQPPDTPTRTPAELTIVQQQLQALYSPEQADLDEFEMLERDIEAQETSPPRPRVSPIHIRMLGSSQLTRAKLKDKLAAQYRELGRGLVKKPPPPSPTGSPAEAEALKQALAAKSPMLKHDQRPPSHAGHRQLARLSRSQVDIMPSMGEHPENWWYQPEYRQHLDDVAQPPEFNELLDSPLFPGIDLENQITDLSIFETPPQFKELVEVSPQRQVRERWTPPLRASPEAVSPDLRYRVQEHEYTDHFNRPDEIQTPAARRIMRDPSRKVMRSPRLWRIKQSPPPPPQQPPRTPTGTSELPIDQQQLQALYSPEQADLDEFEMLEREIEAQETSPPRPRASPIHIRMLGAQPTRAKLKDKLAAQYRELGRGLVKKPSPPSPTGSPAEAEALKQALAAKSPMLKHDQRRPSHAGRRQLARRSSSQVNIMPSMGEDPENWLYQPEYREHLDDVAQPPDFNELLDSPVFPGIDLENQITDLSIFETPPQFEELVELSPQRQVRERWTPPLRASPEAVSPDLRYRVQEHDYTDHFNRPDEIQTPAARRITRDPSRRVMRSPRLWRIKQSPPPPPQQPPRTPTGTSELPIDQQQLQALYSPEEADLDEFEMLEREIEAQETSPPRPRASPIHIRMLGAQPTRAKLKDKLAAQYRELGRGLVKKPPPPSPTGSPAEAEALKQELAAKSPILKHDQRRPSHAGHRQLARHSRSQVNIMPSMDEDPENWLYQPEYRERLDDVAQPPDFNELQDSPLFPGIDLEDQITDLSMFETPPQFEELVELSPQRQVRERWTPPLRASPEAVSPDLRYRVQEHEYTGHFDRPDEILMPKVRWIIRDPSRRVMRSPRLGRIKQSPPLPPSPPPRPPTPKPWEPPVRELIKIPSPTRDDIMALAQYQYNLLDSPRTPPSVARPVRPHEPRYEWPPLELPQSEGEQIEDIERPDLVSPGFRTPTPPKPRERQPDIFDRIHDNRVDPTDVVDTSPPQLTVLSPVTPPIWHPTIPRQSGSPRTPEGHYAPPIYPTSEQRRNILPEAVRYEPIKEPVAPPSTSKLSPDQKPRPRPARKPRRLLFDEAEPDFGPPVPPPRPATPPVFRTPPPQPSRGSLPRFMQRRHTRTQEVFEEAPFGGRAPVLDLPPMGDDYQIPEEERDFKWMDQ